MAEVSAGLALFGAASWTFVTEFTGGYKLLFGLEMALLAGLATWAALRRVVSKPLLWGVMGLNLLLLGSCLFVFETAATLSPLASQLLLIDMVVLAVCLVIEWSSSRAPGNVPVAF